MTATQVVVMLAFIMATFGYIVGVAMNDEEDGGWYGIPSLIAIFAIGLIMLIMLSR